MDRTIFPNILTLVFAVFVVIVMWLYLPRGRQLWLAVMILLVSVIVLNVWFKI